MSRPFQGLALIAGLIAATSASAQGGTLGAVKTRGYLVCGTSQGLSGFSRPDAAGRWTGFDTDVCRAIAAAIFDDLRKLAISRCQRRIV